MPDPCLLFPLPAKTEGVPELLLNELFHTKLLAAITVLVRVLAQEALVLCQQLLHHQVPVVKPRGFHKTEHFLNRARAVKLVAGVYQTQNCLCGVPVAQILMGTIELPWKELFLKKVEAKRVLLVRVLAQKAQDQILEFLLHEAAVDKPGEFH